MAEALGEMISIPRREYEDMLERLEALSSEAFIESLHQALANYEKGNYQTLDEFFEELDQES